MEVVDGMFLIGGVNPESFKEVTANEICSIVDTDTVECQVVGDKSEFKLIGHLGLKNFYTVISCFKHILLTFCANFSSQTWVSDKMDWPLIYFSTFNSISEAVAECSAWPVDEKTPVLC